MIQKSTFGFEVVCDGHKCQEYLDVDSPDHSWIDVTNEMKKNGWASKKDRKGEWDHFCPDCK